MHLDPSVFVLLAFVFCFTRKTALNQIWKKNGSPKKHLGVIKEIAFEKKKGSAPNRNQNRLNQKTELLLHFSPELYLNPG